MNAHFSPKKILLLSGLDPSGGAGLQADIQVCSALGFHSLPIMTCNTIQTDQQCFGVKTESADWISSQLETLQGSLTPDAVKIGATGSIGVIETICQALVNFRGNVTYDPVISAGGGGKLTAEDIVKVITEKLLPLCTLITPNQQELFKLTDCKSEQDSIEALRSVGANNILVTGGHDNGTHIRTNRLYVNGKLSQHWHWKKLPGEFHGTGCTFATAVTCFMAQGFSLEESCSRAQDFTLHAVSKAYAISSGQKIPNRITLRTETYDA